ncbi:hypothetical protein HGRIS_012961 [Hohenbuehelia grisea]|uniref:G domain-containing protein n=1 Tax=Hohenbuehelia grisea TaxID=104357 RepID=A0ABR3IU37_9AGAR
MLKRFRNILARIVGPEEVGNDIIIAILGPTGSGKSSFINVATNSNKMIVGHTLQSYTKDVRSIECTYPGDDHGRNIVFVDTPGLNFERHSANDVEIEIKKWLSRTYPKRTHVDGIIYLYQITSNRMTKSESPITYEPVFESLCGPDYSRKTMLLTTMWKPVDDELTITEEGIKKQWRYKMERLEPRSIECAWHAIDSLLSAHPALRSAMARDPMIGQPAEQHVIIPIFGRTGSGKSTFINLITGSDLQVTHGMSPCTQDLSVVKFRTDRSDLDIIFIDTPSCGNAGETLEVTEKVNNWLRNAYKRNVRPSGVVWLHRILDDHIRAYTKEPTFVKDLCNDNFSKVLLATTMWDEQTAHYRERRTISTTSTISDADSISNIMRHPNSEALRWETRIIESFWKPVMRRGAPTPRRHNNTLASAWAILDAFILASNMRCAEELQHEMAALQQEPELETKKGAELLRQLSDLVGREQGMLRHLRGALSRGEPEGKTTPLRYGHDILRMRLKETVDEVLALRVPVGRHLLRISAGPLDSKGTVTVISGGNETLQ